MKVSHRMLSVVCIVLCAFVLPAYHAQAATFTVQRWNQIEISLTSNITYANPYKDVDLSATFSGPGGITMTMPGFWDGGNTWKVRFAPPAVGTWTYSTSSTDPGNTGLNNQTGTITCTAYTGSLPIYQHGFLKPSANNRYLVYDDGTPFYWLGDTHWSGFNSAERLNESNDPRFASMFKGIIDQRVAQGYTVWKAETFANNNEGGNPPSNEGGASWGSGGFFNDLNPGFWQNIDQRMNYLASKGLVISFAQGIGRSMTNSSGEADHKRLARYILARYGAYPTVWITAQEYNDFGACGACWANVASYVYGLDPYKRANSMHNGPTNPIAYHDQAWYGFVTLQQAHNRADSVDYWLNQYNANPARPVLEDEANYEDIIPEYGGGVTPKWKTRQSAWQSQVGGAFGFTYGAQGIWWGCYTNTDPNGNCGSGSSARAWNTAIDFPVGQQMSYVKAFWTAFDWWTLAPDGSAITWSGAPTDSQKPYQKTDGTNRSIVVAYLPLRIDGGATYTGVVRNLSPTGSYQARWFDPRNGTYTTIASNIAPSSEGTWSIPAQPNASDDWVLLIRRTGGTNTAPVLPATRNNLALGKSYASSSNWDGNQTADNAFDSNPNTNWQAGNSTGSGNGFNNSWLEVDFGNTTTFNTVALTEYDNRTKGFRIEYWNGSSWQTAYTGTTIGASGVERSFTFPAVAGSKARVLFTSGTTFSPIIYEFEVANNLALGKTASSSSSWDANQTAAKAVDGNLNTNWQAGNSTASGSGFNNSWVKVDFGGNATFDRVTLAEYANRTTGFRFEYWNGSSWQTAYTGGGIGDTAVRTQLYFCGGNRQQSTNALYRWRTTRANYVRIRGVWRTKHWHALVSDKRKRERCATKQLHHLDRYAIDSWQQRTYCRRTWPLFHKWE